MILFFWALPFCAQNTINIDATLVPDEHSIKIAQEVIFKNTATVALDTLYFNDWANSFSSKTTPLAKRFGENYDSSFHFEKLENRGNTTIHSISISSSQGGTSETNWHYGDAVDILKVALTKTLQPGEEIKVVFNYTTKVPDDKFTRYGVDNFGNFKLRYWFISPAVFDTEWRAYSNKNTDDLYLQPSVFNIAFTIPEGYTLTSGFDEVETSNVSEGTRVTLTGERRNNAIIHIEKASTFESIVTDKFELVTSLKDRKVSPAIKALAVDRIVHFLDGKLGPYPFKTMMTTEEAYKKDPVYGLNQLPDFISPFPDGFEYDMEQLKTITRNYLENTLALHPRNDYWLIGALQIYLMTEYVDTYYPKMKIIGSLSNWWIIKWAHASDLEFNDQYPLLYLNMARNNLHQSLVTPKDSLVKFNKNIANDYYAGDGLNYLADYIDKPVLEKSIKDFYKEHMLQPVAASQFQEALESNTTLPINWFFEDYVGKRTTIDFKIKKVKKKGDSLEVTIKNLKDNKMPVSIYGLNKDEVLYKQWTQPIDSTVTVTVPSKNVRKLALNYEAVIPEFNLRNNYKKVKGVLNRPLQFRLFQDVEDPKYNQLFFMPVFEYNLYDGISLGMKLYNKTVLPKGVHYKVEPQYGFGSNTLIGSGSISYTQRLQGSSPYSMRYGISGNYYSYDVDLFYKRITPFMVFAFRSNDLRDNEKQFINIRNVNVFRDENPNDPNQSPNYSVFNAQYVYSNPNLINYFRGVLDYQISQKFSKITATFEYRKLFLNNRQLNIRAYAGAFLFNDSGRDNDFFSFALDRPTDYLFDYNYYGRSEDTGIFSQQLIVAEGGFKSQLEPAFANTWITTVNASTNIWKWIYAYGDVGLVDNRNESPQFVYDSGVRLSLVADYFELYFPMYSNLGWEPGLPNYEERIRFIVTLSPKTLLSLFTRAWY
ncbi:M1 family metallopeptidase [Rasiella rasia]|uniref:M1 family metallopeptidase n=1 Tax=Rasiella rasia TaxID=2744027 RepID=A0A6G6GI73_9FLAO|nr:M1 family metallopeptidase [Rasiella rasia]QIE58242.1 M1 family metallopeptidase [Rasiella rasia]